MFAVVVPGYEKNDQGKQKRSGWDQISDVKADLLLNINHGQVGDTAADISKPEEPIEERVDRLLAEPFHL